MRFVAHVNVESGRYRYLLAKILMNFYQILRSKWPQILTICARRRLSGLVSISL